MNISSTDIQNDLPQTIRKMNTNSLSPYFFTPKSLEIDINSSNSQSNALLKPIPQQPKPLEQPNLLKYQLLKENLEESKESNSINLSINEKCELKESSMKQRKKIDKNSRKSLSICVSNLKEPFALKPSLNFHHNENLIFNDPIMILKPPESVRTNGNPESLLKEPSPILLSPPRSSFLNTGASNLPKKRASFQIPPTYDAGDKLNEAFNKGSKIPSIGSFKNQNRLASLKSFHKKFTQRTKESALYHENSEKRHTQTAFYQVISNLYLTKKFISILKNLTSFRKPKWLNTQHFRMMNDLSFDYSSYQKLVKAKKEKKSKAKAKESKLKRSCKTFGKSCKKVIDFLDEILPIFDPTKKISILWDSLVIISICFFFILIPLELSFMANSASDNENENFLVILKKVFLYILFFDFMKSCSSSYYHKGVLQKNRRKIMLNYFKTNFLIDILTITPLILCSFSICQQIIATNRFYFEIMKLIFFLRYHQFMEISKKLGELVFIDRTIQSIVSLLKLVFRIMILAHIFACIWYTIGSSSYNTHDNWIVRNNLLYSDWWRQYLYAYYFVCVTMNTVGFGDISPVNPLEILFVIVFIFVACGIFAYSLNSIGIIVSDIWKRQNEFTKDLNIINQFMREKKINFDLKMRVRKYLEYIWNEEKLEEVEEQVRIINKLSDSLKDELLLEANGPVIREIKLFSLNFSEETLRQMISIMKEVRYTPGDMIFSKSDLSNSLYILRRGEVELFIERSHSCNDVTVLKKLKPGEIFGELSFFTSSERSTSARSTDFTNVFMINQEDFLQILQKNSKDFQRFCEIRDNIQIYQNYDDMFLRCFSCKSVSHQLKYCPLLHYIPKNDIVILKHNFTTPQDRGFCSKNRPKKCNALINLEKIEKAAYKLQEEIFPRHETSSSEGSEEEDSENSNNNNSSNPSEEKLQSEGKIQIVSIEDNNNLNSQAIESNIEEKDEDNEEKDEDLNEDIDTNEMVYSKKIKRRISRRRIFIKKETGKKTLSKQLTASQKDKTELIKLIRESLFVSPADFQKKFSLASEETKEKMEEMLQNMPLINSIFPLSPNHNSNISANNNKKEEICEVDRVKSFEDYYPHNNIETVVNCIEREKFRKLNKKIKKSNFLKSKYQLFIQNNLNVNESIPTFLRGSTLYDKRKATTLKNNLKKNEKYIQKNNDSIHQPSKRYYFKNSLNLQKLIAQEKFDPEKLKEYYRKKYMKTNRTKQLFEFFKNVFGKTLNFFKKIAKKKKTAKNKEKAKI